MAEDYSGWAAWAGEKAIAADDYSDWAPWVSGVWSRWLQPNRPVYLGLMYEPARLALRVYPDTLIDGIWEPPAPTLRAALYMDPSTCTNPSNSDMHGMTNEVPTENRHSADTSAPVGYDNGGQVLTNVSYDGEALRADNATWIAGKHGLTARYIVYYIDAGPVGRAPLCYGYLGRKTAQPGEPFTVEREDLIILPWVKATLNDH